jgi:hypothetical protein
VWEAKRNRRLAFVRVPAASEPGEPLFVGLGPVSEAQYNDLTATRPFRGDGTAPVAGVSWYDAVDFCNALSEKEGLRPYYQKVLGGFWGFRKPWGVQRDAAADGFRLPTVDEIHRACGSPHGTQLFDPDLQLSEWCDNAVESEGRKAAASIRPVGTAGERRGVSPTCAPERTSEPTSGSRRDARQADKATSFRVVTNSERGLLLTSADESFSDETRRLIHKIEQSGRLTPEQARVQALLLQTLRQLRSWSDGGGLALACWCMLAIGLWLVIAAVVASALLLVVPDALLEPILYVLGGAAIVAVAIVRLTQFDTSVHLAPPESALGRGESLSSARAGKAPRVVRGTKPAPDPLAGRDRKNDRFRLGRLDDVFDPSMLVGLWALVGVLLGVQIALALRLDQAADWGSRLSNALLFALDTTAGGLLLNSLDTLGLSLRHESGVPAALTLGLRFMAFGLVCWAIGWNILRIRMFYVQGLFHGGPDLMDDSPQSLEAWHQKKAADFWYLPNAYADEAAFLSLAAAFVAGDYAYVRRLSSDFHGVNVTEDVRLLFRDPDGLSTFAKGWKPGWKRELAQWLWSAGKTRAAWLWQLALRMWHRARAG